MKLSQWIARIVAGTLGSLVAISCATAADESRVAVFAADGSETSGPLQSLSHESLTLAGRISKWSDVVWVRFERSVADLPQEPRGSAIWLANGDRLIARPLAIQDEQLRAAWLRFSELPEFAVPLESVRGVSLSLPQSRGRRDEIAAWLFDRKAAVDELRLINGDAVAGELTGWRAASITLKSAGTEIRLPNSEVRDIGFNPDLLALPEPQELCWLVSLRDGSRITLLASKSRVDATTLKAAHVSGIAWDIPLEAVFEMRVLRGKAVFLSDLIPLESRHSPFLPGSREWPVRRDRTAAGQPLRLGGQEFPKGLGMHSRSTVTYDLAEKYRAFQALVGLDDTTVGRGTATCAVDIDGRRVFEQLALNRAQAPQRLPLIDVVGARRLTLTVDFGELGDSQDYVNWCDAVLLRKGENEK